MRDFLIGLEIFIFAIGISWATKADLLGNSVESMIVAGLAGLIAAALFFQLTALKVSAK